MKIEIDGFGVLLIIILGYMVFNGMMHPLDALWWGALFFIGLPLAIVTLVFGIIIIVMIFAAIMDVVS